MLFKIFLTALFLFIAPLNAHPHVFADVRLELIFNKQKITAIRQSWQFDEFFSSSLITDFDADHDQHFKQEESEQLKKNAFENLANYAFFNHIFNHDQKITEFNYTDFSAKIVNNRVVYDFTLTLAEPVEPIKSSLAIGIYDPEFFVDLAYVDDNPVIFNHNNLSCAYEIKEDAKNPIFMGLVKPKTIYFNCQ